MSDITSDEYMAARAVVSAYEQQQARKKLTPYEGCTKEDFVKKIAPHAFHGYPIHYYWVTKGDEIPEREPDGTIEHDEHCGFFKLERSQTIYDTLEKAETNLFRNFKRKGYIQ